MRIARLWGLMLLLLAGCGGAPQPALRVGVNPWVGYDPLVLARERGLLDPGKLRVIELGSNSESQRALRNGLLDAAALTLDEALRLADEGVPLKIVAILDVSKGADAVLASRGIHSPAQLKGRRIAVEQTAVGALVLENLLKAGGLGEADVKVLHVEAAHHEEMLRAGRADAVITFEPMKSRLAAAGFGVVFDSSQMPGEIIDVLVTRADMSGEEVRVLLSAWEQGRRALLSAPEAAAAMLAQEMDLAPPQYLATLRGLEFVKPADSARRLSGDPAPLARQAAHVSLTLQRLGLIHREPAWSSLLAGNTAPTAVNGGQP